ncbi:MAG TPA: hypothetical protein VIL55_02970 [Naasia sp.]
MQIFTTGNGYGLDASTASAVEVDSDTWRHSFERYSRLGQQRTAGPGPVSVMVRRHGSRWTFDIEATAGEPIKSAKLILRGLPAEQLDRGWWSPASPREHRQHPPLQWNYPSAGWATRWAATGGITLAVDSPIVAGAVLHVATPSYAESQEVEVVHAVPATQWSTSIVAPTIRLQIGRTDADARADLTVHQERVARAFGLVDWDDRADVPSWARELEVVVTLHGQHWTGHVFHDYADMSRLLTRIADEVDPAATLVYLPGWEGRYYHEYPIYRPAQELGGDDGFADLVGAAHSLGFRLMPMFGAHGANVRRYPGWEKAAIRNPSNRYPVMLNSPDWDGDRYPEGDQVFLNPAEPGYQAHLLSAITDLADRFGVDAVFFDTASFWFDDPRHPLYDGFREITATLRARFPDLLLVSEGWWDAMLALFPISQQWLGIERDIQAPEFLTAYARTTSHLAEGTPGLGSTGVHEQGFRPRPRARPLPGHLPVVSFAGGDGELQLRELRALRARTSTPAGVAE